MRKPAQSERFRPKKRCYEIAARLFFFRLPFSHLDGKEPEYLRADAGDDVVAHGERAVSVRLPELYELLSKLFAHLTTRR